MPVSEITVVKPNVGKDAKIVRARPGTTVELNADRASADGKWRRNGVCVTFGSQAVEGKYADGIVTMRAPSLPPSTREVKIGLAGRWSPAAELNFY